MAIPNSVTNIGWSAFENCTSLGSVTIPKNVSSISSGVFKGCTRLNSVGPIGGNYNIEYGWEDKIITNAFAEADYINSVQLKSTLTEIEGAAFRNCINLKNIHIPTNIKTIYGHAFDIPTLQSVTFDAAEPPYIYKDAFASAPSDAALNVPCGCVFKYQGVEGLKKFYNYQTHGDDFPFEILMSANGDTLGYASLVLSPDCSTNMATVTAVCTHPKYHFDHWEDLVLGEVKRRDDISNPRNVRVTEDVTYKAVFERNKCGDELYWEINGNTLIITGKGDMYDYSYSSPQWSDKKEQVTSITFPIGITSIGYNSFSEFEKIENITLPNSVVSIGSYAFSNCSHLEHITLGSEIKTIGDYAFANAPFLLDVTAYMPYPPEIYENVFTGCGQLSDIDLYVPAEYEGRYRKLDVWRNFRISIIGAESTPITTNTVQVVPADDNVQITWPVNDKAFSYTLEITKDGVVFCTLIFNGNGQLTGIAFAPGRNSNAHAPSAMLTEQGYQFTVTGLNPGTVYNYQIDVKDSQNKSIATYSGTFSTNSPEAISTIKTESVSNTNKILRNGQIFILRGGRTYTLQGQEVK